MTDQVTLVVVVAALYLSECVVLLRYGSVLVRSGGWRRATVVHPSATFGNEHGGLAMLNLLPPFGSAFIAHQWPLTITRESVSSYVAQAINFRRRPPQPAPVTVRCQHVRDVRVSSNTISVGGERFAELVDELQARRFASLIQRWAEAPAEDRVTVITRELRAALDVRAARERVERYRRLTRPLRWLCHLLFVLLLVLLPLSVALVRFVQVVPWLVALALPCWLAILLTFYKSHASLMPAAVAQRWRSLVKMVLMPIAAVRARDAITKDLLAAFDPLTVAAAVCEPAALEGFGRNVLLDLQYPLIPECPADAEDLAGAQRTFGEQLLLASTEMLRWWGPEPGRLTAPPVAEVPEHLAYCPRCRAQYRIAGGACEDCGGRRLVEFSAAHGKLGPVRSEPVATTPALAGPRG
jgi:hypothetical protein